MKNITDVETTIIRPERILQFGEGNFLRAFVDWMVDILNEKTSFIGNIVVAQPLSGGMGEMINAQKDLYTTILRGVQNGKTVEEYRRITSISRVVNPYEQHEEYMRIAENADLRFVVSNTTEAGIAYHEGETLDDKPQASFPGKVTAFLYHRFQHFGGDAAKGLVFIPCELIDKNGDALREIVLRHAHEWHLCDSFIRWVEDCNDFCNSLVDRIVPGYPREEAEAIWDKLGYRDNLLDTAEIFHLWVIECHKKTYADELPFDKAGLNVVWTDDMSFYRTRKVRILNGAHTMSVLAAWQAGLDTVEECTKDPLVSAFMKKGVFTEIIPSMDGDKDELEKYAADVLERFANPYIRHMLLSISLNSISKFKTRNLPSLLGYFKKKGSQPCLLVFSLAALISFYRGTEREGTTLKGERNGMTYPINDSPEVLDRFAGLYAEGGNPQTMAVRLASGVLSESAWWGQDLTTVEGLEVLTAGYLEKIWTHGVRKTMEELIQATSA
ncbi:tagaturonate reductase [Parasphaerochaeta coccoides]|uniref:Tagaturonate reductase n=1 Tax=Parasphaerochaeta coccoides (strain ATCC BAA-1237 / DSM 17374 / SPN1) TaxID=760011 RepID=F4GIZ5_PARC1|nr:tagaturonate reductase [Parasphaerochaeta coccoides]AEC01290.1 tagaturonate reductase [Parasphaerochaeta coccoides DSM 17374]